MSEIIVYGVDTCADTLRTRKHLDQKGIRYQYVNLEQDEQADQQVKEWNGGRRITPTVLVKGAVRTVRLAEPTNEELDDALQQRGRRPAA